MHSTLHHEPTADAAHLRAILRKLEQAYGSPRWTPNHDPLGELVATILSQNTSDVNSDRAFAALRAAYHTWDEVSQAQPDDLASVIRSGGLAKTEGSSDSGDFAHPQSPPRPFASGFPDGDADAGGPGLPGRVSRCGAEDDRLRSALRLWTSSLPSRYAYPSRHDAARLAASQLHRRARACRA